MPYDMICATCEFVDTTQFMVHSNSKASDIWCDLLYAPLQSLAHYLT